MVGRGAPGPAVAESSPATSRSYEARPRPPANAKQAWHPGGCQACCGPGLVAGGLHEVEEGLGLAEGGCGGVDVDAVGVGGFGGGGHLAGGAVGGGNLGVGEDGGVGGLRLGAAGGVEVVEFGRVGGVHLVLDHEHVAGGGGGGGDVAAQVPAVQGVAAGLGAGGAGDQGQVAAGGLDDFQAVGVGELA